MTCSQAYCNAYRRLTSCSHCNLKLCRGHNNRISVCGYCSNGYCSDHNFLFSTCTNCQTKCCSTHSSNCTVCSEAFCTAHATPCSVCSERQSSELSWYQQKGPLCHSHSSKCSTCNTTLCSSHATTCLACKQPLCPQHALACSSCKGTYCNTHLNNHTSTRDKLIYCVKQSEYGRFESPANIQPKEDGVGTFFWPNGKRTMCWFHGGKLVLSQTLSDQEQAAAELTEEKLQFEAYKEEQEAKAKELLKGELLKLAAQREEQQKEWQQELQDRKQKYEDMKREETSVWRAALQIEKDSFKKIKEAFEEDRALQMQISEQQKESFAQKMEEENTALQLEKLELEEAKKAFEVEQAEVLKFVTHNQQGPIKLNIGGTHFQTTLSSLAKYPSMLSAMFSGRFEIVKDESGEVFIDRDGTHFRHILNFMRDGLLPSNLSLEVRDALKVEAGYYQMNYLTVALDSTPSEECNEYEL